MGDLVAALLPALLGLLATPAAIIACLVLLETRRPVLNVSVFALMFLLVYGALSFAVLGSGRLGERLGGPSGEDPATVRGWTSGLLGVLFLALGAVILLRDAPEPHDAEPVPGWVRRLRDPSVRSVMTLGLALAVLNPHIAILGVGLGVVLTADISPTGQMVGVTLLLAASMMDFVVPPIAYALGGPAAGSRLREATAWMVLHTRLLSALVLVLLGLLFSLHGLAQLATAS
ncbi:GAP family protein [Nocardioides sp. AN3]